MQARCCTTPQRPIRADLLPCFDAGFVLSLDLGSRIIRRQPGRGYSLTPLYWDRDLPSGGR